ncbi:MAG: hypothetical protein HQL69_18190, partial [Magnetococcales bacterium]|nr:hypothetical protein [Magnetococcales bacterium]
KAGNKNRHIFAMNDPDDGGKGRPVADIFRFLVGLKLSGVDYKNKEIINSYKAGLRKKNSSSKVGSFKKLKKKTIKRLADEKPNGKRVKDSYLKKKSNILRKKDDITDYIYWNSVAKDEKDAIKEGVKAVFNNKVNICKTIKFKKIGGGSGGLTQYRLLLLDKSKSWKKKSNSVRKKLLVLDLKPLVRPGIFPLLCGKKSKKSFGDFAFNCVMDPRIIKRRVKTTLKTERDNKVLKPYGVHIFPKIGPMLMRPRWLGDGGVDMEHVQEYPKVMHLEAYVLGRYHRDNLKGNKSAKKYAKAVNKAKNELKKANKKLSKKIVKYYAKAKKEL